MKTTISVIKADIGSIGGHICPSRQLLDTVREYVTKNNKGLLLDFYISHTGDDVAILTTHTHGVGNKKVHKPAWEAFVAGTETAKQQGFSGPAMLPYSELEYGGIVKKMAKLEPRFKAKKG